MIQAEGCPRTISSSTQVYGNGGSGKWLVSKSEGRVAVAPMAEAIARAMATAPAMAMAFPTASIWYGQWLVNPSHGLSHGDCRS